MKNKKQKRNQEFKLSPLARLAEEILGVKAKPLFKNREEYENCKKELEEATKCFEDDPKYWVWW